MGKLVFGAVLVFAALVVYLVGKVAKEKSAGAGGAIKTVSALLGVLGVIVMLSGSTVIIAPGEVGVRHAFGTVDPKPLLSGIRFVAPWSEIERYSTREEQFPESGEQRETMDALSAEQMSMQVDVGLRWQIDPQQAPRIFTEIGDEAQIHSAVRNAIRKGTRDGMVQFTISDISKRQLIAQTMEALVDSALITHPRVGGPPFRIAQVTTFFLRNLEPPAQVVAAINSKIAQEQQIETERHRVEVTRLQAEQQRLINTTLTAEQLTKQYLEVLRDMRTSNNLVIMVPTTGGIPMLDVNALRNNLRQH